MMGGVWAYETLGWGGYWGWDPVENSSLVPWLVGVAAIHTTLSQRKRGAFVRTNLALGILCFILVVYSTFLTRSGVLGDTSVHSFVDPGMWVYGLLVGVLILATGLPAFLSPAVGNPRRPARHHYLSREFALFLGAATLVIIAVLVIIGTSSPLITGIFFGSKSAVDISYYVQTVMPLGVAIGLLTGIGQLLWWTKSNKRSLLEALVPPGIGGLLTIAVAIALGAMQPLILVLLGAAMFGLVANVQVGWRIAKTNLRLAGGAIAHIGIGVMLLGFVVSSEYDREQTVALPLGKSVDALGFRMTYQGTTNSKKNVCLSMSARRENVAAVLNRSCSSANIMTG
jgi:cytochrome c-type biogenesis protein CcmF